MEPSPIRVGIAGFGMSGQLFHAPFLDADPRFEIRKVFERSTSRAESEYPYIETVQSYDALLADDIDLVILCTPNAQHTPMARQALEAGKHVITEKPAAASSDEVRELAEFARGKGLLYTVFQNRRLDGDFLTVQELIRSGALGEIVDYEAHFDRFVTGADPKPWRQAGGPGVGILWDLGVHLIDQAYVLFGMPDEVFAEFRKLRPETPGADRVTAELYYSVPDHGGPGLRAVLSMSEVTAWPGPRFTVHGTKGSFLKYGTDPQEAALAAGTRPPAGGSPAERQAGWGADDPAFYGTLACVEEGGRITPEPFATIPGDYARYYDNVYEVLTSGAAPLVPAEEAADVLQIIEAVLKSGQDGKRVRIDH